MRYQIYKKFLPPDFFENIKNIIKDQDFPWRRRDHRVRGIKSAMYFTHCFYNNTTPQSEFYQPHIIPILKKLKAVAPIQVRANMFLSEVYKKTGWHRDYNFKCKTALLYLNDCDGGIELRINNKIIFVKADANKMLVFDTAIEHRGLTSKKEPIRYIINFNYFTKGDECI